MLVTWIDCMSRQRRNWKMSSCWFCHEGCCVYRHLMEHAKEDCEFMVDKMCTATEDDLIDFNPYEDDNTLSQSKIKGEN